jgi:hypothetical protein
MLESIVAALRALHIAAGTLALASFWLPWVLPKGSRPHRGVGWVYTLAMALVSLTALATSLARCLDERADNDLDAQFLGLIAVLALANAWFGIRTLRASTGPGFWDRGMATLLVMAGAGALLRGVWLGHALWIVFGGGASFGGATQLRYLRRPARRHSERVLQHIGGMGTTCIATVTAFLVVNITNLGLDAVALWVWVAPGVIGGLAVRAAAARWQKRLRAQAPR